MWIASSLDIKFNKAYSTVALILNCSEFVFQITATILLSWAEFGNFIYDSN
jgi:hypothetical protein